MHTIKYAVSLFFMLIGFVLIYKGMYMIGSNPTGTDKLILGAWFTFISFVLVSKLSNKKDE